LVGVSGELEPDRFPEPAPINCLIHGEMRGHQFIRQIVEADPIKGGPAPATRSTRQGRADLVDVR
jgi:hypothetical protein